MNRIASFALCLPVALVAQTPKILNLASCSLKLEKVETTEKLVAVNGHEITPERRGCHLVLVRLKGQAPGAGALHYGAESFSAAFAYRGAVTSTSARAHGVRGRDGQGKIVEHWFRDAITTNCDGKEDLPVLLAFELPKDIKEFEVRIPVHLGVPVRL